MVRTGKQSDDDEHEQTAAGKGRHRYWAFSVMGSRTAAVSGEVASAAAYNTHMNDIGDALTACLKANGASSWTGGRTAVRAWS